MHRSIASRVITMVVATAMLTLGLIGLIGLIGVSGGSHAAAAAAIPVLPVARRLLFDRLPAWDRGDQRLHRVRGRSPEAEGRELRLRGSHHHLDPSLTGCGDPASQDAVPYSGITQERAALNFIAAHKGAVRLITISIGGNDFDGCSTAPCVRSAMPVMEANIKSLVGSLSRALVKASDTKARIIGLTYPDVDLGLYVYPDQSAGRRPVSLRPGPPFWPSTT